MFDQRAWRWVVAFVFLAVEAVAITRAVDFLSRRSDHVAPPFTLAPLSAKLTWVRSPGPDGGAGLFKTDRLLALNGEPFRGHAQWARAFQSARPGDSLSVEVEHYPRNSRPWTENVSVPLTALKDSPSVEPLWWFGFVVWPGVCTLLAVSVIILSRLKRASWLALAALAASAQFSRMAIAPGEWPLLAYDSLVKNGGLFALAALAALGTRDRSPGRLLRGAAWIWAGWSCLAVVVVVLRAERLDWLRAAQFLEPPWNIVEGLALLAAGVGAAIRFMEGEDRTLRSGMAILLTSAGLGFVVLPWFGIGVGVGAWLYSLPTLALPISLASVGLRGSHAMPDVALPDAAEADWRTLFESGAAFLEAQAGLQLLAVYGKHSHEEEEFRVRASLPGDSWPPVANGESAPVVAAQTWRALEAPSGGRLGYIVVAQPDHWDDRAESGLDALSQALSERLLLKIAT